MSVDCKEFWDEEIVEAEFDLALAKFQAQEAQYRLDAFIEERRRAHDDLENGKCVPCPRDEEFV
jgi:hypothetical protein